MSLGIVSYVHICKSAVVPVPRVRKLYGGRRGKAPVVFHLVRARGERLTRSPDCYTGLPPDSSFMGGRTEPKAGSVAVPVVKRRQPTGGLESAVSFRVAAAWNCVTVQPLATHPYQIKGLFPTV